MNNFDIFSITFRRTLYILIVFLIAGCTSQSLTLTNKSESWQKAEQTESPVSLKDAEVRETTGGYSSISPYPTTLEGFLQYTDLIVMATLGDMKNSLLYGYNSETGEPIESPEKEENGGISVADFTLEDVEILWASEKASVKAPLNVRVLWSDEWSEEGVKRWEESLESVGIRNFATGDRYLFVLAMGPDGKYGMPFDENRLLVDKDGVLYYSQMSFPYPLPTGPFTEGERYGEAAGPPLTVDDLVRAAEGKE